MFRPIGDSKLSLGVDEKVNNVWALQWASKPVCLCELEVGTSRYQRGPCDTSAYEAGMMMDGGMEILLLILPEL